MWAAGIIFSAKGHPPNILNFNMCDFAYWMTVKSVNENSESTVIGKL